MTPENLSSQNERCCGDAAAYALGALDASEAAGFRRHLETCVVCRDEADAFARIADALATVAPPRSVPRGLRRKIMGSVRAELRTAAPRAQRRHRRLRVPGRLAARPALVGGVMAGAALALIGGLELAPSRPGIRVIQARVNEPTGSARLRVAGARAELRVSHLPRPPAGQIYEVWIERDGHPPSPTSLFRVSASGAAVVGVAGDVRGASTIMVTQEHAGGSLVPTRPPVIVAKVS